MENLFVLGITGPTSLVIISIGSTLKEFKSAAEQMDDDSTDTPSKASKSQREQSK